MPKKENYKPMLIAAKKKFTDNQRRPTPPASIVAVNATHSTESTIFSISLSLRFVSFGVNVLSASAPRLSSLNHQNPLLRTNARTERQIRNRKAGYGRAPGGAGGKNPFSKRRGGWGAGDAHGGRGSCVLQRPQPQIPSLPVGTTPTAAGVAPSP